ncbi:hypothetical protein AKJ45_00085 [candidate division MSBL1 archaeon SCGC-AAA261F19]|uniref:Uncharacterized protein n=2 Tax=candidate division MSBL1 TaxID=215777 RepID=A0A133VBT9_9EURY|nr:hypothetical protein AKJ43_01970 [candidate division MSBL1 archaeon SCGC-AAA261D19]KXB03890.1 hypothetical protein AKJ45_00085 [candidate division MSBL1 archaeon SCGC-AAA261F19]
MVFSERSQGVGKWVLYLIVIAISFMVAISLVSGIIMDYYWFRSVGYLQVFMINIRYQLILLLVGWIVTTLCLVLSWRTVSKALNGRLPPFFSTLFKIFSVFVGLGVGLWLKGEYLVVLRFLNQASWGSVDPVFGYDISFYVFTLPMVRTIFMFIGLVSGLVFLLSVFIYGTSRFWLGRGEEEIGRTTESFWSVARFLRSWPILGSVLALTVTGAVFVWLGRFSYLWGFDAGAPVPTEAAYMATHYLILYTWVKAIGVILIGILVLHVFRNVDEIRERLELGDLGHLKKEGAAIASTIVIFVLIPGVVFGAINALNVEPNEPGIQKPYIERCIQFTNEAYGLDNVVEVIYPTSSENLSSEEALESPTVRNARIVDYRPIKVTYEEKQRLRTYYEFHDVDVDRYLIEGEKQLVVISGREMDYQEDGWQNQHLFFTHGFGVVVSPANQTESDGTPIMKVKDIPPLSEWEATEIKEPRIYFGERTNDYVVVKADGLDEFDYPKGELNIQYRYEHDRGVKLDSVWKRLIGWFYTNDLKILVSDYIGQDSRLLLHRNVQDRVEKIAPFLRYDPNAHFFLGEEGGLHHLLNGITWTKYYPYAYSNREAPGYLSDSVKAFIKTNTGDVEFYVVDENDPMVRTYSNIYPDLFKNGEEMSNDYREHLIYPEGLFNVQMDIFKRYHMKDYQAFYQKEDLWAPAEEKYHGLSKRVEPYNIFLDVSDKPGFENENKEFILVKPFTPQDKRNMRAWVGVAQDPLNYGRMIALLFPKGELVRGPMQVEAIIDQDEEISQQFSLWEGAGSNVLRGNLLVLPVKDDIIYIEPVYLSAESLPYPQLKRVVTVYGDEAVMENDLEISIKAALVYKAGEGIPAENVAPGENVAVEELVQVVQRYLELRNRYNELISEQKYAEAGIVMENIVDLEERMENLVG